MPDFVSNSGGVLGAFMGYWVNEQDKKKLIEKYFSKRVSQVIQISREEGLPPINIAEKIAMKRFHKIKNKIERSDLKYQIGYKIKSLIPKVYRMAFIKSRLKKSFAQMLRESE